MMSKLVVKFIFRETVQCYRVTLLQNRYRQASTLRRT